MHSIVRYRAIQRSLSIASIKYPEFGCPPIDDQTPPRRNRIAAQRLRNAIAGLNVEGVGGYESGA